MIYRWQNFKEITTRKYTSSIMGVSTILHNQTWVTSNNASIYSIICHSHTELRRSIIEKRMHCDAPLRVNQDLNRKCQQNWHTDFIVLLRGMNIIRQGYRLSDGIHNRCRNRSISWQYLWSAARRLNTIIILDRTWLSATMSRQLINERALMGCRCIKVSPVIPSQTIYIKYAESTVTS